MRPLRWHWRRWRHRVPLFWTVSVVLAAFTGLAMFRMVAVASEAAARYGSLERVPVVVRSVGVGSVVGSGDVTWRAVPRAFVPRGGAARAVVGRVAVAPLVVGEVVVEDRLAPRGLRGAAALVPPGMRAVSVRPDPVVPSLRVGDRVDVLATVGDTPAAVVARTAVVVEVDHDRVTVAVPAADAPSVAYALTRGAVTLALVGAAP